MSVNLALTVAARSGYVGKTDFYGDRFLTQLPALHMLLAMEGKAPYDVTANYLNETARSSAIERLNRYRLAWRFYKGDQWDNPWEDGELKPVMNFIKKIADSAVDWFVAKGWSVTAESGNEQIAELVNECWEANNRLSLTEQAVQFGTITGDMFFYVTLDKEKEDEVAKVKIEVLNPAFCFPVFDSKGTMTAFLYQYPMQTEGGASVLYSLIITPTEWKIYWGEQLKEQGENAFNEVNVVHVPNFVLADSCFGQNDIHQVIPLNEEYNTVLNSVRRVIKYHAEPTTLIFGVKAGDMERGAKKVWSNLPTDAKVENLKLDGDLEASNTYLDRLERMIGELSNTPKVMFDSDGLRISNTSGLAMQMQFQPMIDKTRKRRTTFTKGIKSVNRLILKGFEILGVDLTQLGDNVDSPADIYCTDCEYTSPLPRDEQAELDAAAKKIELKVWSRAEAMRQLSGVNDFRRLVLEVMADERAALAMKAEEQKAAAGIPPNFSVVFLSSAPLSEDFESLVAASETQETAAAQEAAAALAEQAKSAAAAAPAPAGSVKK